MPENLPAVTSPTWVDVPYVTTTDRVLGGLNGPSNASAKALHERTEFLKQEIDNFSGSGDADLLRSDLSSTAVNKGANLVGYLPSGTGAITTLSVEDKLRESISVLDFGAVGDNLTDCTSQINLAIARVLAVNGELYWPAGTYVISGNLVNFGSVKHTGTGVIKQGGYSFYISPKYLETSILYVAANGSSVNDGLHPSKPLDKIGSCYLTLAKFGDSLQDGNWKIKLAAGNYTGELYRNSSVQYPPTTKYPFVIEGDYTLGNPVTYSLSGKTYVSYPDLVCNTVVTSGTNGSRTTVKYGYYDTHTDGRRTTIQGIKFVDFTGGVLYWEGGNILVQYCEFERNTYGVWTQGPGGFQTRNCKFVNNTYLGYMTYTSRCVFNNNFINNTVEYELDSLGNKILIPSQSSRGNSDRRKYLRKFYSGILCSRSAVLHVDNNRIYNVVGAFAFASLNGRVAGVLNTFRGVDIAYLAESGGLAMNSLNDDFGDIGYSTVGSESGVLTGVGQTIATEGTGQDARYNSYSGGDFRRATQWRKLYSIPTSEYFQLLKSSLRNAKQVEGSSVLLRIPEGKFTSASRAAKVVVQGSVAGGANASPKVKFFIGGSVVSNLQVNPIVKATTEGYLVAWERSETSGNNVYFNRYDTSGAVISSNTQINTITDAYCSNVEAVQLTGGNIVFVWQQEHNGTIATPGDYEIFYRVFNSSGVPVTSQALVYSTSRPNSGSPQVTQWEDGFIAVWESSSAAIPYSTHGYDIFKRPFNSAGVASEVESLVVTATTNTQAYSSICTLSDASVVIAWSEYIPFGEITTYDIKYKRYSAGNLNSFTEGTVNTTPLFDSPHITVKTVGTGFVVVWNEYNPYINEDDKAETLEKYNGYYKVFDGAGGVIKEQENFSDVTTYSDIRIIADITPVSGGFIITWTEDRGPNAQIVYRKYNTSGVAQTDILDVSSTLIPAHSAKSTTLSDGSVVFIWGVGYTSTSSVQGKTIVRRTYLNNGTFSETDTDITERNYSGHTEPTISRGGTSLEFPLTVYTGALQKGFKAEFMLYSGSASTLVNNTRVQNDDTSPTYAFNCSVDGELPVIKYGIIGNSGSFKDQTDICIAISGGDTGTVLTRNIDAYLA